MVQSKPHKVKGYADDLTILSSSLVELEDAVSHVDGHCKEVCLCIQPDKCYSLHFDGKETREKFTISVNEGTICNIKDNPTSFLGTIVSHSKSHMNKISSSNFSEHFYSYLKHLNDAPVRGKYSSGFTAVI